MHEFTDDHRTLLELIRIFSTIGHYNGVMPRRYLMICDEDLVRACLDEGLIEPATRILDNGVELEGVGLTDKGRALLD